MKISAFLLPRGSLLTAFLLLDLFLALPSAARAADAPAVLDDFSDAKTNRLGLERVVVTDTTGGGASQLRLSSKDGVLTAQGEIVPARGQPGWASLILLLSPTGAPVDLSKYEGIRVKIRVRKGMVSIAANSTEIKNFDYHSFLLPRQPGEIQEVRVPFKAMRRGWSEQVPLNPATVASLSLVAFDLQRGEFAYEVDEVGFY